jgi:hypothetical protein
MWYDEQAEDDGRNGMTLAGMDASVPRLASV